MIDSMTEALKPAKRPRLLILGLALLVFQFSYAGPLLAGPDEEDYAAREEASPNLSGFAGGQAAYDPDGISASSMVWVLVVAGIAVVLLIVMGMAGLYDGPSASPSTDPPSGADPKSWSKCVYCDGTGRQRRLVAQHDDGRREYVYDTCHMCKGAGGTWR